MNSCQTTLKFIEEVQKALDDDFVDDDRRKELKKKLADIYGYIEYLVDKVENCERREANKEITDEQAIEQLQRSGWMQRHDKAMSFDSLTAVVNGLMLGKNKTISINIYPWTGSDEDGDR